jgi:hypothetical protein
MKHFSRRDSLWILPLCLAFGAVLSSLQAGDWLIGWLAFSFLFLLSFPLLIVSTRWAVDRPSSIDYRPSTIDHRPSTNPPVSNLQSPNSTDRPRVWKTLTLLVTLAFFLRLAGGVTSYILLPLNGYDDADDRAGYIFTDAHRRDDQAWELATSDLLITSAFSEKYAYDQYGGLLAFSALVYRYVSPDMHRPLLLVLLSAFVAALGLPFLWKAASLRWGAQVGLIAGWIYALYPESVLLGGAAMREPYLMTFGAMALWGFVGSLETGGLDTSAGERRRLFDHRRLLWLGLGLIGMLLVSPGVALVTLGILGGWLFFSSDRRRVPWWAVAAMVIVFAAGLLVLSSALDPNGELGAATPFGVVNDWLREAVKWNLYKIEESSGWVQKLFAGMPAWLRLPFVMVYGIFQPVLPAALIEPTKIIWQVIAVLRAAGWYALLPVLVHALVSRTGPGAEKDRRIWLWLAVVCWAWVLLTALRGGGDQWDNPRYRAILFVWQALTAGAVLVRWQETRDMLLPQIVACELAFLAVFTQWYASRYFHWGGQLPFGGMVVLILALWAAILAGGWWWSSRQRRGSK